MPAGKPYLSPLRISVNCPSVVIYQCSRTNDTVGKVYKTQEGKWYLNSKYLGGLTIEVFAKYKGFLLLKKLYEDHQNNKRSGC